MADYDKIHGKTVDASSRAANNQHQPVVKDRFIIDIRDAPLTDDLRHDLEGFNDGRYKYRLQELWVMSQGMLYRIDLRT